MTGNVDRLATRPESILCDASIAEIETLGTVDHWSRAGEAHPVCPNMVFTSEQVSKELGDILGDVPIQDVVNECEIAYCVPVRGIQKA